MFAFALVVSVRVDPHGEPEQCAGLADQGKCMRSFKYMLAVCPKNCALGHAPSSLPGASDGALQAGRAAKVTIIYCETRRALASDFERALGPHADLRMSLQNVCAYAKTRAEVAFMAYSVKVRSVLQFVTDTSQRGAGDSLLIYVDTDVLLQALSPSTIEERFLRATRNQRAVLFQAEPFCWVPHSDGPLMPTWLRQQPDQGWLKGGACTHDYLTAHSSRSSVAAAAEWRCPRYLNAGAFAGRARDLVVMLRRWLAQISNSTYPDADDQAAAARLLVGEHRLRRVQDGVTIELDVQERLFAFAGAVTQPNSSDALDIVVAGCGDRPCKLSRAVEWQAGSGGMLVRSLALQRNNSLICVLLPPCFRTKLKRYM